MKKRCCHCKQYKTLDCFTKDKNTKDGLKKQCRECRNFLYKSYHQTHPEVAKNRYSQWLENPENKIKRSNASKRYYHKNLDVSRELSNSSKKTELGKARVRRYNSKRRCVVSKQENTLTLEETTYILDHQKGRCAKCQTKFSSKTPYTVDHIIPVSKGGSLTMRNVQLLCRSCNASKNDKTILYRLPLPIETGVGGI